MLWQSENGPEYKESKKRKYYIMLTFPVSSVT
jgi:hypothetical protein